MGKSRRKEFPGTGQLTVRMNLSDSKTRMSKPATAAKAKRITRLLVEVTC
jgi:hypothetical protein